MSFQDVASRPPGPRGGGAPMNGYRSQRSSSNPSLAMPPAPATTNGQAGGGDAIRDLFNQYQQNVAMYEKLCRSLGTHRDGEELRDQIKTQDSVVQGVGERLEQYLGAQLKSLDALPKSDKDRIRAENNKLTKDFMRVKLKFQNYTMAMAQRMRDIDLSLASRGAGEGDGVDQGYRGDERRLQLQLQQEDIDEKILQEREEEIMEINKKVVQVNAVFKDLAEIVNKQQEDIDHIEHNVEESHKAAKSGLEQIEKAAKYQPGCILS